MPNIRESAPQPGLGLNPTELGIDSISGAARRMGAYGGQIADSFNQRGNEIKSAVADAGQVAVDYMDHREISAGAAKGTELMANATAAWNKITSDPNVDPNDPTIAKKFIAEQLEPALDSFKQGFNTEKSQQFAEQFVERYRNHMFEKTTSDMMGLAKIAITTNIEKTQNALGSMVANDPSSLESALATYRHTVDDTVGSSPTLDGVSKAAVRSGLKGEEAIVKAAVSSMITKNPNIDLDAIQKKYGEYINGAEMKMFAKQAQTQAKADLLTQKALETYQRKESEVAVAQNLSKVWTDSVSYDGDNRPVVKPGTINALLDIERKYPGIDSAAVSARIENVRHSLQQREEAIITNPKVQADLLTSMTNPDPKLRTDETKILQAANQNSLSPHATSNLLALRKAYDDAPIKDPVFHSVMGSAQNIIQQSFDGHENYGKFAYQFMTEYQRLSRAGQLKPDDLDMTKDDSLISKMMAPYKPTPDKIMQYHIMKGIGVDPSNIQSFNTGGSAPAKRNDVMPAIPPPDQRPAGSIYETPRGKMRWTGTGWMPQ